MLYIKNITILLILVLLSGCSYNKCFVKKITDGDTLTCQTTSAGLLKMRLAFIDAPEICQTYGAQSKQLLKFLIDLNNPIEYSIIKKDIYNRNIAIIYQNKVNINLALVEQGGAWAYKKYLPKDVKQQFIFAQHQARQQKKGLWHNSIALNPAAFRKTTKCPFKYYLSKKK